MSHTKRTPAFLLQVKRLAEKVLSGTLDSQERAEVAHSDKTADALQCADEMAEYGSRQ